MKHESVAILDIRSGDVTFALGSKGVNGTFVFKDSHSEEYEGYLADGFLDEASFRRAVVKSINAVRQNYGGVIDEVCVGVPAPFVSLQTKGHTISFPAKRKITAQDVDALYESGLNELLSAGRCIHRSAMYFSLGDNRRYFSQEELYGTSSTLLKGALCYYFISEELHTMLTELLASVQLSKIKLIPSTLAQAAYLLPEKQREGYAFLLDIGFLTTSVSVVYGNGIVRELCFNCGAGTTRVALMQELGVDYSVATEILNDANISGGSVPREVVWSSEGENQQFSVQTINDIIKCNLDLTCEQIDGFFSRYYKDKATTGLTASPISVTGEGVNGIKGVAEHVSRRLNRLTEIVAPDLPYFDKPVFSSRISLLNAATGQGKKKGFLERLFGGKR